MLDRIKALVKGKEASVRPAPTAPVGEERELVSRTKGAALARAWADAPTSFDVPNTLLSSRDIVRVAETTGLISPFFVEGGRKARLKKAAYEGRVGTCAYIFEDRNVPRRVFDSDSDAFLHVPKNSIVFVECDLDFRLPDFIASRFNLQIQHVHRGLLLGTGPLVDPGFWGKLCIPLHNLTDQDYDIPKGEGLIWVEFTKTTLSVGERDSARAALSGAARDEAGHWDILKFLDKAANQYDGYKIPIKSSLPTMFEDANKAVAESAQVAKSAMSEVEKLRTLNSIAMVAAAIGLCAFAGTAAGFLYNLGSRNEDIAVRLQGSTGEVGRALEQHFDSVARYGSLPNEARAQVPMLRVELARQRAENVRQRGEIERLTRRLDRLERANSITFPPPFML